MLRTFSRVLSASAVVALLCGSGGWAQPGERNSMQVMATVGCLIQGEGEEDGTWFLTNATQPVPAGEFAEETAAEAKGDHRFPLVGTLEEFSASKHKGHKVRVKGLVNKNGSGTNINVTSVKHVSPQCVP